MTAVHSEAAILLSTVISCLFVVRSKLVPRGALQNQVPLRNFRLYEQNDGI